ncbi:MAG: alpha/beta hydrolase family protein [Gammaproteobacteria bacterium]|jgi:dipeptidyl aminopeptidase/acylaminoacyl peptidase
MQSAKLSLLVGGLLLVAAASAQQTPATDPRLKRFDTNGDGVIDASEKNAVRDRVREQASRGRQEPKPGFDIIAGRRITEMMFPSHDGRQTRAVLSVPENMPKKRIPLVVTIHGGQGNRDFGYLRTLATPPEEGAMTSSPTVAMFNEQPWAILSIDYRLGGGDIWKDALAGIRYAKTLPGVDPDRVCAMGGSHGGKLLMEVLTTVGRDEFRCAIAGSPFQPNAYVSLVQDIDTPPLDALTPSARQVLLDIRSRMGKGSRRTKEELVANSFETHAGKVRIPTLMLASKGDDQVPYVLLQGTIERMQAAKAPLTLFVAEQVPHGFYWGRENAMARVGRGERSPAEREEEARARAEILKFLKTQFR